MHPSIHHESLLCLVTLLTTAVTAIAGEGQPPLALLARQRNPQGYDYCNGRPGSICAQYDSYKWEDCSKQVADSQGWYRCYCESGKLATRFACEDCSNFYGLVSGGILSFDQWKDTCAQNQVTVGPVPTAIIASWAAYNATQTAETARPTGPISTRRYVSIPGSGETSTAVVGGGSGEEGGSVTSSTARSRSTAGEVTFSGLPTGGVPTASVTGGGSPLQSASSSPGGAGGGSAATLVEANLALAALVFGAVFVGIMAL